MHGEGKLTWIERDGTRIVYKGQMFANVIHGFGIMRKSNGDYYKGEFVNGRYSGQGTYLFADPKVKYEGHFVHGLFHGIGELINHAGVYKGDFCYGLMQGKG